MGTTMAGPQDGLARFLGYFSLGLGAPQTAAPWAVNRLIGVRDDAESRVWQFVVGVRELAAAAGILSERHPVEWTWARVAGDAMDLALLSAALRGHSERPARTAVAMGAVAGITVADVLESVRLSRMNGHATEGGFMRVDESITVRGDREEVARRWREQQAQAGFMDGAKSVEVRYVDAPRGQGTEIHLHFEYSPPLGAVGAVVEKVRGDDPGVAAKYELLRFKQMVETGEVVRSDGTPEGPDPARMLKQRPAQPLEAGRP
jgi:uncharacterized membrane protein